MELTAELIVFIAITGIFSVIVACSTRLAAPFYLCGLMFASSISSPAESGLIRSLTWIGPLQTYRSYVFIACSGLLLLNLIVQSRRYRPTTAPANAVTMLIVGLTMGLLLALQGDPIQGILTATAAIISLGAAILFLTQTEDYRKGFLIFAGCVMATSCLINAAVSVQFLINPNALLSSEWSRRFQGLTGNPQFLGVQLALYTTTLLWLLMNTRHKLVWVMLLPLLGMNALFLLWTGSRTGLGMFVLGISIVMFSRFKRAAIAIPVAAIGVMAVYKVAGAFLNDIDTSRLTSLENTRKGAWSHLFSVYRENPIIGAGFEDGVVDKSESSLLYSMATYGTSMGLLYILAILTTVNLLYKLFKIRHLVDTSTKGMIDLVFAINASFFAGSLLEGYFIARVNVAVVLFVCINVVGYQLLQQFRPVNLDQKQPTPEAAPSPGHNTDRDLNYAELAIQ